MAHAVQNTAKARINAAKRIVIKVGSALLCQPDRSINTEWLAALGEDIIKLRRGGCEVMVVSSGAVAVGRARLGLDGPLALNESQAAAAAGQAHLLQAWQNALAPHDVIAAQVLLTLEDTEDRRRYLNARGTIETLLQLGAAPIINENDTVATIEIRYGDNDRLAAHTAQLASADLLIVLSDIDGLYTADPHRNDKAVHIPLVDKITPAITAMAVGANKPGNIGSGGMVTKIAAAKIAMACGCATIIARGDILRPISALTDGARATVFTPGANPDRERRKWIAGRLKPAGRLFIDAGAVSALNAGKSLLPAGVTRSDGAFQRGDAIVIIGPDGKTIAQGLSAYDSAEVAQIFGLKSQEIETVLGYKRRPAIVDRNDLVMATTTTTEKT